MSRTRWEHFAHKADMGVRGFGESKESAFEQAALAAMAVIADLDTIQAKETVQVTCEAPADVLLWVDWLNSVVFEIATRKMLFSRFEARISGTRLAGRLLGT